MRKRRLSRLLDEPTRLIDGKDPFDIKMANRLSVAGRTPAQRESDLVFVTDRYLKGWSVNQILDELNNLHVGQYQLSIHSVKSDIDLIHKRWIASYLVNFDQAKANELAKIDALEQEYWNAWRKSQQKIEEIESEKVEDKQGNQRVSLPQYSRSRVKRTEKSRDGSVDFLKGVQWCIEARCKILGLTMNVSTQNINVNWRKEAEAQGIDPEGAMNELVDQFVRAAASKTYLDGGSGSRSLGEGPTDPSQPGTDNETGEV